MMSHGFVRTQFEVKLLILYILAQLCQPVERAALTELVLAVEGVNYFQFPTPWPAWRKPAMSRRNRASTPSPPRGGPTAPSVSRSWPTPSASSATGMWRP